MEKRFITFLVLSLAILVGYTMLMQTLFGPPEQPPVAEQPEQPEDPDVADPPVEEPRKADAAVEQQLAVDDPPQEGPQEPPAAIGGRQPAENLQAQDAQAEPPQRFLTLGSLDSNGHYRMLVVLNSRGATVEAVELNSPDYRELNHRYGYLGNLKLGYDEQQECRIQVVGPGSPAAMATSNGTVGLRGPEFAERDGQQVLVNPGDRLIRLGEKSIESPGDVEAFLKTTRAGQEVEIEVERTTGGDTQKMVFMTTLSEAPLQILDVEPGDNTEDDPRHPGSLRLTLCQIGVEKTRVGHDEIKGLPSLLDATWSSQPIPGEGIYGPGVEFRTRLSKEALQAVKLDGPIEVVKRYRLAKVMSDSDQQWQGYTLRFEFQIFNGGEADQKIAYQLDGPTGMTKEGWWYSYKTHPRRFAAAGARDIAWREEGDAHKLFVCSQITKKAKDKDENPLVPLTSTNQDIRMQYVGCDTQYFATVLMPHAADGNWGTGVAQDLDSAVALAVGPPDKYLKRTDVTFRLKSRLQNIGTQQPLTRTFDIYIGPKDNEILEKFKLEDFIVYGWFGWVSKPMLWLLHRFYWLTGSFSYGLAIILLTVCVRAALYPTGRKMAKNAQTMQQLAPEMKKIADKYKNDMEKRAEAQRELFKKHGYNPLSGCLVMFIQMPVFLGLYRGLSCDIELRQAPLIPGLQWCSNLAGPDMFWNWEGIVPEFLSSPHGFFGMGPFLNLLPMLAVCLFIVQQKLFTPPPQDEQQAMQHQVMKFMMVFMGLIFHKMAAGLCLYIVVSTLWGLGERLLLPKPAATTK